jgi:hypothetical protein
LICGIRHRSTRIPARDWSRTTSGGTGAFVYGAIRAGTSFIDAPAACRAPLPEANPCVNLAWWLAATLPFDLLLGRPRCSRCASGLPA